MAHSGHPLIAPRASSLQQQQNVLNNNGKKPPPSRREKERRRDRKSESSHDGGESKENQEAQMEPLGEPTKDGETKVAQEVKSGALKKRGGEGEEPFLTPSRPLGGAQQVIPQCAIIYLHPPTGATAWKPQPAHFLVKKYFTLWAANGKQAVINHS